MGVQGIPSAEYARVALAGIRIFNGLAALLVPRQMSKRLGTDPHQHGAMFYVLRMFGIRTVLLGLALLTSDEDRRACALRDAPLIHATDTAAAAVAGVRGQVPARVAVMIVSISAVNTFLAMVARGPDAHESELRPPGRES